MNKTLVYAKSAFILFAIAFAVLAALPAHAKDRRKEMIRVAKLINKVGHCKLSAEKKDSDRRDWDLEVKNFYPGSSDPVRLEACHEIGGAIHCVRAIIADVSKRKGDCFYDRLVYSPATANQELRLTTEKVRINRGKKDCLDRYFDDDGKEDATLEKGRTCTGKKD